MKKQTITLTFSCVDGCTFLLARWRRRTLYHGPLRGVSTLPPALRNPIQHNLDSDAGKWAVGVMERGGVTP